MTAQTLPEIQLPPGLRDFFLERLRQGTAVIRFKKVSDDTERLMRCTLMPSVLPPVPVKSANSRKESATSLAVWDIQKEAWRSFCPLRVISAEFNLPAGVESVTGLDLASMTWV